MSYPIQKKTTIFFSVNSFSILAITLALMLGGLGKSTYAQDTLSPQQLKLPDMPLHDPYILPYEPTKTYYLYTSNVPEMTGDQNSGTMVYKSKDLLHWDKPTVVFTVPENSWADPEDNPWAPEVHAYKGKFYLFTTLHNKSKVIAEPPEVWRTNYMRSTVIAVSDSPDGPFKLVKEDNPILPADFMTLDGTLYVDPDEQPWMVYAHEWIQKIDGTMEAVALKDDLSDTTTDPICLFRASKAPWLEENCTASRKELSYVTDGPQLFRTKDGNLLMLWSSYENGVYVQTVARSQSGQLEGPWVQLQPIVKQDSGHGMLFGTFDGQLMMVLHRPFRNARGKLYEMQDAGDHLKVLRQRTDLDGDQP